MRRKEITLVISQKKYIQIRLAESTSPNMAAKKKNSMEKKKPLRSANSVW